MYYYKIFDLTIKTPFELNEIAEFKTVGNTDIEIYEEEFILPKMQTVENLFRMNINPEFGGDFNDAYFDWGKYGAFRIQNGKTITFNKKAAKNEQLNHFLLTEPLTMALHQRGYYLIHASAIVLPNKEVCLFFGEPGAGKSTTMATFLQAGCTFLSDDLVAISFDIHNQPWVLPAFPNVKLWQSAIDALDFDATKAKPLAQNAIKYGIVIDEKFHTKPEKLTYIFSLERDDQETFSVEKINGIQAHLQPMRHFPLPVVLLEEKEGIKKRFIDGVNIIKTTTFFKIIRNKESFEELKECVNNFIASTSVI